ncbi:polysaccharide biosynthesis protein [Vagococcus xieshaowenii]|uniref:Polysaccharide biosynthesis protein n=1 Tax=Vagococcus xieshaowenii TaxID=2562451 RepID=A0AAJ5EER5_9ENTE|nr:polysaccharide biosynthesis protein [Vagococcus xieshaowenii]QCA28024.1 polysaccharide biosynthesis protein [Vagococcus xieshaowenii]TFZ40302.1 polysaccharide biosynthesis protein [Vagococcus xieshaowenii]
MKTTSKSTLLKGTVILSISAFLVKILSATYRVPFQNIVGDEGFYVFQQVYPIYGIASIMALEGLPLFISKLVAESDDNLSTLRQLNSIRRMIWLICLVFFFFFLIFATPLAELMGDTRLSSLIRVTAFLFLLVPNLALYRGYMQGKLMLEGTAISQLIEQVLRVMVIIASAIMLQKGLLENVYQIGVVASTGAIIGAAGAVMYITRVTRKENALISFEHVTEKVDNTRALWKRLLSEGGMICLYAALLVVFQLVDSFMMKNALVASGVSELEAKIIKGAFDRGQPLAQVGMVISTALVIGQLPNLMQLKKELGELYQTRFKQLMKLATIVGLAATVGLMALVPELNVGLFGDNKEVPAIRVFLVVVALMSVIQMLQVIAQTNHANKLLLKVSVIGIATKCLLSYPLIYWWGSIGASLSTLFGLMVILGCLYYKVYLKEAGSAIPYYLTHLVLLLVVMYLTVVGLRYAFHSLGMTDLFSERVSAILFAVTAAIIGGFLFCYGMIKTHLITKDEYEVFSVDKVIKKIKR